jgi:hypothetical protein
MAGLATPFAPLALTTLINQAEKNGLPAEVSNTAFNRFVKPQNYTSELAGGLFDFKQSYEAAKQGN